MTSDDGRSRWSYNGEMFNFPSSAGSWSRSGTASAPAPTPRAILRGFQSSGATMSGRGSKRCSPWRSGTARRARCGWRATRSASSRSTYTLQAGGLAFGSELKALVPVPGLALHAATRRRSTPYFAFGHTLAPAHDLSTR